MAKQRIEVKNPTGVNLDKNPADLSLQNWTSAGRVSFENGYAMRGPGSSLVFNTYYQVTPGVDVYTRVDTPTGGIYVRENGSDRYYAFTSSLVVGTRRPSIWRIHPTEDPVNVSRTVGGDYTIGWEDVWDYTTLNSVPVANTRNDIPQVKLPTDATFKNLPNWPVNLRTNLIRGYKNFLVALYTKDGATEYPTTVRWSSEADPGQVPNSWNLNDPTISAGEAYLADTPGSIIAAEKLRDSLVIYKDDSVYSMNYIGGVYIFSFRKIFDSVGAIGPRAVAEFEGKHFVVGGNDIYVHDGVQRTSVGNDVITDYFFRNLSANARSKVALSVNHQRCEIRISGAIGVPNLSWNWKTGEWSMSTGLHFLSSSPALVPINVGTTFEKWTFPYLAVGNTYQNLNTISTRLTPILWRSGDPFVEDFDNPVDMVWKAHQAGTSFPVEEYYQTFNTSLSKSGISFGDDRNIKVVSSITPHIKGAGRVTFRLGTQDIQDGPITWSEPKSFTIGSDYKLDFRMSGRYFAIEMTSASQDASWKMNGYTFEFEELAGRR